MHTRPISLIEHTKKIFTKIITTRIANVICRYPILSKHNHVAIPNTSTALPISTLTHIINDAHANKKELWMLSQDMSKAYDTVHILLLIKALERIKIPKEICQLVNNIFAERHNSVITNHGTTNLYLVHDGIDQGETITPLLWRIYYDPLISRVSNQYRGYSLNSSYITQQKAEKINSSFSVLAFMDDTMWIANSKQEMSNILLIASSFFCPY